MLKNTKDCPIFKLGNKQDVSNDQPISWLTLIAKTLEKVGNKRLSNYLKVTDLLAPNQFGFRPDKIIEDAVSVTVLTETVAQSLNKDDKCIGTFLDLKKAFDAVLIPLLLRKPETFEFKGLALGWFTNHLSDRRQFVNLGTLNSNTSNLTFGVTQGKILGPPFF